MTFGNYSPQRQLKPLLVLATLASVFLIGSVNSSLTTLEPTANTHRILSNANQQVQQVEEEFDTDKIEKNIRLAMEEKKKKEPPRAKPYTKAELDKRSADLLREQIAMREKWQGLNYYKPSQKNKKLKKIQELVIAQIDLGLRWDKLRDDQEDERCARKLEEAKQNWTTMSVEQKLVSVAEDLRADQQLLFSQSNMKESSSEPQNINLQFNLATGSLAAVSQEVDDKGRPILEWEMNKTTGHVIKTIRSQDGKTVHVFHKDVDAKTLDQEHITQQTNALPLYEFQHESDMALKIKFFAATFVIMLFFTLYLYLRKLEQEDTIKTGIYRHQSIREHQQIFLDALKNGVQQPGTSSFVSDYIQGLVPRQQSVAAQYAGTNNYNNNNIYQKEDNQPFGNNNLENLSNDE